MLAFPVICVAQENTTAPALPEQQITNLDELLQVVKQNRKEESSKNRQREQKFLLDNKNQKALLKQARRNFELSQTSNNPLVKITQENDKLITDLRQQLESKKQEMGDIYSTFSELSGDFSASLQESMISAQYPNRAATLTELANTKKLATIDELQTLWLLVQEEMTEQGKLATFTAPVVTSSGHIETRPVLRIGGFTAFSNGAFLRYIPETGELLELDRQPSARQARQMNTFSESSNELLPTVVDPTGGSLLGMMSYTPTVGERIEQGGVIGSIIIAIAAFGLLFTLWRVIYLCRVYLAINTQLKNIDQPNDKNPLGRVLLAASNTGQQLGETEGEAMQYKLDEVILAELPALERGHNLIKLFAATSPLLGLLGTVTGMILTFQTISLFGSGDPKLMAGGISQALITTVLGLVAAIPLLFGYSLVSALSSNMVQRLDEQSAGTMAKLIETKQS
jgi:biopolymer transport protein ExbB